MSKKIVVITGSPRKNGNSFAMTDAFIEAVEKNGHTVTRFDAAEINVVGCRACDGCYKDGKACAVSDDFNEIAPAIEGADAIIFTMPLYWYSFPAQIKAVIDKFYSFCVAEKDVSGKECAVLACCEEDDASMMDGITGPCKHIARLLGWNYIGEVLVTSVHYPEDIHKTDGISRVAEFAGKI